MREFWINDRLSLRLENNQTNIYIDGIKFRQCKYLLLDISIDEIENYNSIKSIDDVSERLDNTLERNRLEISPELEFWGHCSNLQVWFEHNYDTRFLHSNLAFHLLLKLASEGDLLAKKVIKEEIAKRMNSGAINVAKYLVDERFLNLLSKEELKHVLLKNNTKLKHKLKCSNLDNITVLYLLLSLVEDYNDDTAKIILKDKLVLIYESNNIELIEHLEMHGFYDVFTSSELRDLIFNSNSPLAYNLLRLLHKAEVSIKDIFNTLDKLERLDSHATKFVLLELFMVGNYYTIDDIDLIKEHVSEDSLFESFHSTRKIFEIRNFKR